ncbi:hypothetical protein EDD21DRAFT_448027 [Dissophora ornata]|nr:hypothetical protein EDD21DRAFT_448027 [Dissophora ornata]
MNEIFRLLLCDDGLAAPLLLNIHSAIGQSMEKPSSRGHIYTHEEEIFIDTLLTEQKRGDFLMALARRTIITDKTEVRQEIAEKVNLCFSITQRGTRESNQEHDRANTTSKGKARNMPLFRELGRCLQLDATQLSSNLEWHVSPDESEGDDSGSSLLNLLQGFEKCASGDQDHRRRKLENEDKRLEVERKLELEKKNADMQPHLVEIQTKEMQAEVDMQIVKVQLEHRRLDVKETNKILETIRKSPQAQRPRGNESPVSQ